ncbi:DNA (cytosine-5)-methyltransferase 1 [Brevibacillus sp. IT-7CA2]|uniref:DNA cytosine methyltransferase n=1 Tax=Brevibacillus sp. IT-7CA2 TaxID=3026436 RepID=UPI0039E13D11
MPYAKEIFVDNFAGGGGASNGVELATGRSVDIAINHDPAAIAMHTANHPETEHYQESVWNVDPRKATKGRPVALCWQSPDCTHHSKASGGKPKDKNIRGLAWNLVRWGGTVRPRVQIMENVEEFRGWGPLVAKRDKKTGRVIKLDGTVAEPGEVVKLKDQWLVADPKRKGKTFRAFVRSLREQGYQVEWREIRACDYGAPTIRKRFFLIARCDGKPIVWPKPSHGDPKSLEVQAGRLKPWRTAAEIIDWSIPCPSIFDSAEQIKKKYGIRVKRPLAEKTLRRIAKGIQRYVIESNDPFVISDKAAFITEHANGSSQRNMSVGDPLRTICAEVKGGHFALVTAFLAQYHSETANHEVRGQTIDKPIMTLDTSNRYALVTSNLLILRKNMFGQEVTEPIPALTAGGGHVGEVRAFLMKYYGSDVGQSCTDPLHTVTTKDRFGLVTVHGEDYQIVDIGMRMLEPHELFAAQGFPPEYIIDQDAMGNKQNKKEQVARCGNAVPPPFAEALVRANLPEHCTGSGNAAAFERYKQPIGQMALTV